MMAVQDAKIETVRGVTMTEYRVRGSLVSVFQFIESLFKARHPAGYGTRVHSLEWDYSGEYVARISHANSAD